MYYYGRTSSEMVSGIFLPRELDFGCSEGKLQTVVTQCTGFISGSLLFLFFPSKERPICPQMGGFEIVFWLKEGILFCTLLLVEHIRHL